MMSLVSSVEAQPEHERVEMSLASRAFADGGVMPDQDTQAVSSPISPPFTWTDAPADTVSFCWNCVHALISQQLSDDNADDRRNHVIVEDAS
jgi:phosphatidylethanolamine-binding protein (PEBP) family uncharacterized protein